MTFLKCVILVFVLANCAFLVSEACAGPRPRHAAWDGLGAASAAALLLSALAFFLCLALGVD